ncbi:MAG: fused MFS/spermidine synthase [Hyphomicrobiaceae bacterium]
MNDAIADSSGDASPAAPRVDAAAAVSPGSAPTLWLYTATTFVSALLLFSVQPMFAKMVLPVLGGSPSVWAVAMCFFQAALLAGYVYAHLLIRFLSPRAGGVVHLAVFAVALVALPIGIPASWHEPPAGDPYLWQMSLFAIAVGPPFFAVAANAPLLQAWFSRTGHPHGRDPYFLYAASNLGSLLALLSYPFILEPTLGLQALSRVWTGGFIVLWAMIGACFFVLYAVRSANALVIDAAGAPAEVPGSTARLGWVGLAFVPSALLTAFTNHVTTDVASAPLLWVLPLALYLLTFVLVFRERSLIPRPILLSLHLAAVVAALVVMSQTRHEGWFISSSVGVLVFFASSTVAHRTLYESRPAPQFLTEFYIWMSLGGVLGGLFAALIAPRIFSEIYEYPLLLALSMACRPGALRVGLRDRDELLTLWLLIAGSLLALVWVPWGAEKFSITFYRYGSTTVLAAVFGLVLLALYRWPPRQLAMALMMCLVVVWLPSGVRKGDAQRSYFGVYRVVPQGEYNILMHGTTLHGAQKVRDEFGEPVVDTTPGTYYHESSPMAHAIKFVREALPAGEARGRFGVIGLGSGSMACHSEDGEAWRFFEIDPVMVGIAKDTRNFSYLANCQPNADIVLGDARLTLAKEADSSFDALIVDAFSSDAVPVHLMTAEALRLYLHKLTPTGVVVLHVSNRYLDLEGVLAATAPLVPEAHGIVVSDDSADGSYASTSSTVVVFSKSETVLEPFRGLGEVHELNARGLRPWADDYSDVIGPFLSKFKVND